MCVKWKATELEWKLTAQIKIKKLDNYMQMCRI